MSRSINPIPSTQENQPVRPKYLDGQEISGNMRAILIDWLVLVQMKFRLEEETLYMAVAIIDRFLQVSDFRPLSGNAFPPKPKHHEHSSATLYMDRCVALNKVLDHQRAFDV